MSAVAPSAPAGPAPATVALLSFGNFVVGFGAFVAIGILTPVASDLSLAKSEAGLLITVYAIAYAFGSPILTASLGGVSRERVIAGGLALVMLGSLVCAVAGSLGLVLFGRVVIALGAGLFSPAAASFAAALSAPADRGRVLSSVFLGFTMAQAAGVPAGAWLGYTFGWRFAFGLCGALALVALALTHWRLPAGVRVPPVSLATLAAVLADARLMLATSFTTSFVGASYVVYTFMAPLVETRFATGRDGVTVALLVWGFGGVAGNLFSGRLADRIGPDATLALMCAVQAAAMPLVTLAPLGWLAFGVVIMLWSAFGWGFFAPQQSRLVALDPARAPVLLALNAAFLYAGIALGSAIGGVVFDGYGLRATGLVGGALALVALAHLWLGRTPSRA